VKMAGMRSSVAQEEAMRAAQGGQLPVVESGDLVDKME
jgi:hypothetical protein